MTSLAVYCPANSLGKGDGKYFETLARRWMSRHGGQEHVVDARLSKPERFRALLEAIRKARPDTLAIFDHGLRFCLSRLGVTCRPLPGLGMPRRNVLELASALAAGTSVVRIELFACLTGEDSVPGGKGPAGGDGGLADELRDACVAAGLDAVQVDAHASSSQYVKRPKDFGGDAVSNPFVRRFLGPPLGIGGQWLVEPGSHEFHVWDRALDAGFWLEFPFMSAAEIAARLEEET